MGAVLPSYSTMTTTSLTRSGWRMWFRLITAGLGVVMGCLVFFVFSFGYGNIPAGCWALVSAMFAGLVLHLHIMHRMHRLELWYSVKRFQLPMKMTKHGEGCRVAGMV